MIVTHASSSRRLSPGSEGMREGALERRRLGLEILGSLFRLCLGLDSLCGRFGEFLRP